MSSATSTPSTSAFNNSSSSSSTFEGDESPACENPAAIHSNYLIRPLIQKTRARDITKRRGAIKHQRFLSIYLRKTKLLLVGPLIWNAFQIRTAAFSGLPKFFLEF
jgi:hypothetical protein